MLSEGIRTEFKREYTPNIIKSVVAFANTSGGTLYVGIADDGSVIGVEDAHAMAERIQAALGEAIRPDVTPFVAYHAQTLEGRPILEVIVQKGASGPYYLVSKGIRPEGVYIRRDSSNEPATEAEIRRMIKKPDGGYDADICFGL